MSTMRPRSCVAATARHGPASCVLGAAVCLLVLLPVAARAQDEARVPDGTGQTAGPRRTPGASDAASSGGWAAAVHAYRQGDYALAATHASALEGAAPSGEVTRAIAQWRDAPDRQASASLLAASAAMALELALGHAQAGDRTTVSSYLRLGQDARDALLRIDADATRFSAHWDLARLQVLLLARDFTAVVRAGASVPAQSLAAEWLAEWHVARGLAREFQSRQALWDRPTNAQVLPVTPSPFERELWMANERQAAIAEYRRALDQSPGHLEAKVRLGRVLWEGGRSDQARGHLMTAASRDCGNVLCGLAWLFLGDWYAKHGTTAEAREAYLQASRVLDVRQSALVSLLRIVLRESPGSAAELVRQFDAASALGRQQTPDAWSHYLASSPLGLPAVIGALRDQARQ